MIKPDLHSIAAQLEALEETIIARLIDRAQFKTNPPAYQTGSSGFGDAKNESLFNLRLRYQEEMDAIFGRFCVPEERPFSTNLPSPCRTVSLPPSCLSIDNYDTVNLTTDISVVYSGLIQRLCPVGDDGQYGSSVEHDVYALQAIARRIHFGALYVAESKYRADTKRFTELIASGDSNAIMALLTRKEVEENIIRRVRTKTETLQTGVNRHIRNVIDVEIVLELYRDHIIPLTKKGQVLYLMNRKADTE